MCADPDRLRQVLLNVVTNAVKFTDAGGSVTVRLTASSDAAHIVVRDTGRGIAAEELSHVFERFRPGAAPRAGLRGVGLGLTLARILTELHGGTIRIDSAGEGLGTTCAIDLPLRHPRGGQPSPVQAHIERRRRRERQPRPVISTGPGRRLRGTAVMTPLNSLNRSPTTMPLPVTS